MSEQMMERQPQENELTAEVAKSGAPSIWDDAKSMATAVRMAEYIANAKVIPQAYQRNPGDCLVAIDLGRRMGLSPVVVMQNSQIVKGNFTWRGSACKAMVDGSRKFRNSRYEFCGKPGQWDWGCRLVAENARTNTTVCGPWVTMKTAKDEGWLRNPKWSTMPELMMRYRAASFFAKTECPETLMGFQTAEEIQDITGEYTPPTEQEVKEGVNFSYSMPDDAAPEPEDNTGTVSLDDL